MTANNDQAVRTTCAYCGVGCGILAAKDNNGSVSISGDPDHPANFGRLCSKGSALAETINLEDRLLYPEINGKQSGWNEALDLISTEFSRCIENYGPDSIGFYVSGQILTEDYYIANKLMKGFIGSANIDTNSRLCMASSVAGHRKAFGTDTVPGCYEDLEQADLVVLVGSNLAWCHPVLYQRIEKAKQQRPQMKIVLIDPRRTMTANIADLHLAIETDGDTALFSGLLVHLADSGKLDTDYISAHTSGFGNALELAKSFSNKTQDLTGLTEQELHRFYTLFANTEKVVTVYSQGVNQSASGTDKVSTILNCHLATGRIGKPGMGPFSVTGQPNAMGGREVGGLANMLACHMDLENSDHRDLVQNFWKSPHIPQKPGLKAVEMFEAVASGQIKAIWIMSTNPVDSLPQADLVAKALSACPLVIVSDILHSTDTMKYAHVKLPAAGWGEKDGTVTNSERRISRQRKFLNIPGEAKPDWWHMAEVGKRMGFADAFEYAGPAEIFEEFAQLSALENAGARDFDLAGLTGMSKREYDSMPPVQWPIRNASDISDTRFFAEGGFFTPDRRARIIPVKVAPKGIVATNGKYVLNTGRIRDHWHTMTRTGKSSRLSSHLAEPFCEIHPDDAKAHKIGPASLLRITNENGEIIVRALITNRVNRGNLFVPMHWTDQFASNARVDKLVPARLDPYSGQPALKSAEVHVAPIEIGAFAFLLTREKPDFSNTEISYWAAARCPGGWRSELAFKSNSAAMRFSDQLSDLDSCLNAIEYCDQVSDVQRRAAFDGKQLSYVFYTSPEPVQLARQWLIKQLQVEFESPEMCQKVLAGRADALMPDKGQIICSCMEVGINEILSAIHTGSTSIEAVGKKTSAGTNCGSCRAEINGMIDATLRETKIAAE